MIHAERYSIMCNFVHSAFKALLGISTILCLSTELHAAESCTIENLCARFDLNANTVAYLSPASGKVRNFQNVANLNFTEMSISEDKKRITSIFQKSKQAVSEIVSRSIRLTTDQKKWVLKRIKNAEIYFQSPGDSDGHYRFDSIDTDPYKIYLSWDVMELPSNTVFEAFAHELGHAFDPGSMYGNGMNPTSSYLDFVSCMRSQGVMDGQQTEGFADNIARQTFAGNIHQSDMSSASTALEGMIYFLMEACSAGNADDDLLSNGATNVHPSIRTRVENIYLSNEAIRSTLGCAPQLPAAQECKF